MAGVGLPIRIQWIDEEDVQMARTAGMSPNSLAGAGEMLASGAACRRPFLVLDGRYSTQRTQGTGTHYTAGSRVATRTRVGEVWAKGAVELYPER